MKTLKEEMPSEKTNSPFKPQKGPGRTKESKKETNRNPRGFLQVRVETLAEESEFRFRTLDGFGRRTFDFFCRLFLPTERLVGGGKIGKNI